jgi:hypothetical protein
MTTVNGKLLGAAHPERVEMKATLVDVTGAPAVGYVTTLEGELVRPVPVQADSAGVWSVVLTANSLITSQAGDTLWAIQEGRARDGSPVVTYIAVPTTGGPYWAGELLADLSSTRTGDGTVVYLAGQQGPQGAPGATGAPGAPGAAGQDGASAYQVAVAGGFVGTQAQWLASLVGPEGAQGPDGPQPELGAAGAGTDIALRSTDPTTTNPRTPTAHKTSHATGGSDALTPADIGADTAGAATSAVTAHTGTADAHGDRAWASGQFATLTVVNTLTGTVTTLQGTVTAIDGFLNDCLNRVAAIEDGTAYLAGGHFTGPVDMADTLTVGGYTTLQGGQFNSDFAAFGDLHLIGSGKGYRLRRGGDSLDLEGGGADLILSVWSDEAFTAVQHSYLRFSADAQNTQLAGPLEVVTGLYGGAVHKLDPATGVAALGAKNSLANVRVCGRLATAGAPTTGTWAAGDAVQDATGAWWLCTAGGTPGTWAGGAAGGGPSIRTATARITDGALDDLPSASSWVIAETSVGTQMKCSIAAAAGDRIRVEGDFMRVGAHFLDWALLDSAGAIAVYGTTRTGTPPAEGSPSMYPSTSFGYVQGAKQFVVGSGHINAGAATIALAHQGTASGKVYAHTTYPFEMLLTNLGPEPS